MSRKSPKVLVGNSPFGYKIVPLKDRLGKVDHLKVDASQKSFKALVYVLKRVLVIIEGNKEFFLTRTEIANYREKTFKLLKTLENPNIGTEKK